MSDRVSRTTVLCEDEAQERLVREYLKTCKLSCDPPQVIWRVASKLQYGGNDHWVLKEFSDELHACRQRSAKAKTLLIVVIDADAKFSVEQRRDQLCERVQQTGYSDFGGDDPAVLLIPKRHIETWIAVLLGKTVTEDEDCKDWEPPSKKQFRGAAEALYQWARPNATFGTNCVPSLKNSLPEWRKIH